MQNCVGEILLLKCRGGVEDTRLEAKAKDTKKIRGQGPQKNPRPRPRTAFPRTDTLEAKDRNARGQGQEPRTQAQVLSKKKRSSQKFFKRSPQKNVFQKIFQALHKILTTQKYCCPRAEDRPIFEDLRPRPRTLKSVLEAKDVVEDSTSAKVLN